VRISYLPVVVWIHVSVVLVTAGLVVLHAGDMLRQSPLLAWLFLIGMLVSILSFFTTPWVTLSLALAARVGLGQRFLLFIAEACVSYVHGFLLWALFFSK
jgi:hypothetical protein